MGRERIASIVGVEEAIAKVLAPLGLEVAQTTWKRDLKRGTLAATLKIEGKADEQLALFGRQGEE